MDRTFLTELCLYMSPPCQFYNKVLTIINLIIYFLEGHGLTLGIRVKLNATKQPNYNP